MLQQGCQGGGVIPWALDLKDRGQKQDMYMAQPQHMLMLGLIWFAAWQCRHTSSGHSKLALTPCTCSCSRQRQGLQALCALIQPKHQARTGTCGCGIAVSSCALLPKLDGVPAMMVCLCDVGVPVMFRYQHVHLTSCSMSTSTSTYCGSSQSSSPAKFKPPSSPHRESTEASCAKDSCCCSGLDMD